MEAAINGMACCLAESVSDVGCVRVMALVVSVAGAEWLGAAHKPKVMVIATRKDEIGALDLTVGFRTGRR
jgi:hypothetical protein